MISSFTVQQQPEIGDLYAQEGKPEQELYHQQDEDDGAEAYTESISAALPHQSNFGCLCSSADNLTNHHYGNPFHDPPCHTQWCSAQNLAKTGSGIKRRLPFPASGAAMASATTTNANVCTGIPVRQPDEPKTKKQLPLDQEDLDLTLRGFTKITLPTNFSSPRFHDSVPGGSSHCSSHFPERMVPVSSNPPTPFPVKGSPLTAQQYGFSPSAPVPPLPPLPALRRTTSDPTPASVYNVEESLNSQKRLKRMRSQLREMSEWWDRVLRDQEEEHEVCREQINNATKDDETGAEDETKESVSVEVVGKCLSVNFCCPCGKGYQILLSGRNCYYKLV